VTYRIVESYREPPAALWIDGLLYVYSGLFGTVRAQNGDERSVGQYVNASGNAVWIDRYNLERVDVE